MLPCTIKNNQPNLFHNQLQDMLDSNDPLVALADSINWEIFKDSFEKYYSDNGNRDKDIYVILLQNLRKILSKVY